MFKILFSLLILIGITVASGGVWVALHLKHLPNYPIWIGVGLVIIVIGRIVYYLVEVIKEGE